MATSDLESFDLCSVSDSDDAFSFCDIEYPVTSSTRKNKVLNLRITPRLLRLPREIRDTIWHLVLVEPPYWRRLHKPLCEANPNHEDLETPIRSSVIPRPMHDNLPPPPCRCTKRTNLSLRRVCRQIYAESTDVFYKNNVFFFDDNNLLSKWIRCLTPRQRSMIYHLSVVRPLSKSKSSVYKNIELLPELRALDLDRRFDGGDELERNEERAWEFLSQLQHLERLRLVDAGSYRLARTDTSSYPRETLWHVEYMDLTDKNYGGLDLWDTVHHDAPRERACDHVEHPNFRKPSNLSESTNPVVVDFSRENSEIWCFNFPLPDAVVDRLRKKQRRAELKWERDFLRSQRIKDQAELEMERRVGRSEKLDKLAEQKDQQRKEEVARLQPHKKWHAEVRSRRAGIAKGKGRAERLHLDDEIEWAREDWDSCFNDNYE